MSRVHSRIPRTLEMKEHWLLWPILIFLFAGNILIFKYARTERINNILPPVHIFNVGHPEIEHQSFLDCLAPSPIFPPIGKSGWIEVHIPEHDEYSHGHRLRVKGRTWAVQWDNETKILSMREIKEERAWYRKIEDWIKRWL